MKIRNEGNVDRVIRGVLGILIVLSGAGIQSGVMVELFGIGVIVTAITGWCPLYQLLHIRTNGGPIHH